MIPSSSNHKHISVRDKKKSFRQKVITFFFSSAFFICFFYSPFLLFFILSSVGILYTLIYPSTTKRFFDLERILPTSKVRSMAKGLVELHGTAHALTSLTPPMGDSKCIGYRYVIEGITSHSEGQDSFSTIEDETVCVPFMLRDNTASVDVKAKEIVFVSFPLDVQKRINSKRYSQYLLLEGDDVLLVGKANIENGKTIIEKDDVQNMLVISPFSIVGKYKKYRPLITRIWIFLSITALLIALVLIAPIRIECGKVFITLSFDMLSWKNFF